MKAAKALQGKRLISGKDFGGHQALTHRKEQLLATCPEVYKYLSTNQLCKKWRLLSKCEGKEAHNLGDIS